MPHQKPRIWTVFAAFVIALVAIAIESVVSLACLSWASGAPRLGAAVLDSPAALVSAGAVSALSLATLSLTFGALSPEPLEQRLRLAPAHVSWLCWLLACVSFCALGVGTGNLLDALDLADRGTLGAIKRALASPSTGHLALSLLGLSLAPAIGEELFFRGYVQQRISRRWGPVPAVALASLLFGLLHLDLYQGSFAFFAGLFVGWLSERTGSIALGVVAHAANNALSVVATAFAKPGAEKPSPALVALVSLGLFAICLAALAWRLPRQQRVG